MHLEKRRLGGRTKYYLAHSYREGGRVRKVRKYLGQDLDPSALEKRRGIAEKLILEGLRRYDIINDPLHVELSEDEMDFIERLETRLPMKMRHLSDEEWRTFSVIFTYNTNAIEGSKLSAGEVSDLLDEDKWPDRSKEDIAEAYGVDGALAYIRNTDEQVSIELIERIHKLVFRNSKDFAGKLRRKGEEVVVVDGGGNVVHEGAPQPRIRPLLRELVRWYEDHRARYPALVLGAVVHNQFENIHPFKDGNGRVGRILLNNVLIKHGLPPVNISFKNRAEYYGALQAYEKGRDLRPTIELFVKEYRDLGRRMKKRSG